ncbi:MAG: hypothetical protein HQ485_12320 [Acidobacteria bacterium]|nr:hypothetical protein [Acidobacteriota bacterium]
MPARLPALRFGLDHPVGEDAAALATFLAGAFGPATVAVIHYGSRAQGRPTRPDSAFDFFVVVDHYREAYTSLAASVGTAYSARTATFLAGILAPNVIAVTEHAGDTERRAKCCVISLRDFRQACSPHPRDHFIQGRLIQFVVAAWTRDEPRAAAIAGAIAQARANTLAWVRPTLPDEFGVDEYVYAVLRRSLAGEIRPEAGDHARTLVTAQTETLHAIYRPLLAELARTGLLTISPRGETYRLRIPVGRWEAFRNRWYFRRSKIRTTTRLLKHVALYEGWLDYIVKKIDRSSGESIVLTPRERRWPLVFLWPKVFHYLRTRPQRRQ